MPRCEDYPCCGHDEAGTYGCPQSPLVDCPACDGKGLIWPELDPEVSAEVKHDPHGPLATGGGPEAEDCEVCGGFGSVTEDEL